MALGCVIGSDANLVEGDILLPVSQDIVLLSVGFMSLFPKLLDYPTEREERPDRQTIQMDFSDSLHSGG